MIVLRRENVANRLLQPQQSARICKLCRPRQKTRDWAQTGHFKTEPHNSKSFLSGREICAFPIAPSSSAALNIRPVRRNSSSATKASF